jgi:rubredoxin
MLNTWTCPLCSEVIESVGPVTLQMEIRGHNNFHHPDGRPVPHTWQCPRCPEFISRADEATLALAIKGHDLYKHHREDHPVEYRTTGVGKDEFVSLNGRTEQDTKFLKALLVGW